MTSSRDLLVDLHASLVQRRRPEDVAARVLDLLPDASPALRSALVTAAAGAHSAAHPFSSMSDEFEHPVGAAKQLSTLTALAQRAGLSLPPAADPDDPASVRTFAVLVGAQVGWRPGASFADRTAAASSLSTSRRNRFWRALLHLEDKARTLESTRSLRRATLVGRSAFALEVELEPFCADPLTAGTLAYLVARRNLRREFTLQSHAGTTDEVLSALLVECEGSPSTRWDVLALVRPTPSVLARLSDAERGSLLGRWSAELRRSAELLSTAFERSSLDRDWMTVSRGDDSSTWNAAARAYNTSRDNFLACLEACGLSGAVEPLCPPKAIRLMAADLVAWHRLSGGEAHPDTRVAARLPLPWEVLRGEASCTAALVAQACAAEGVDPVATGWTALRGPRTVEPFSPTRELVHGIVVSDPLLAGLLRRAGAWAGPSKGSVRYSSELLGLAGLLEEASGGE